MRMLWVPVIAATFLAGCEPGFQLPAEVASRTGAIIGGTKETAHPAVGCIVMMVGNGEGLCSGTLITPRIVLTAAHCVSGSENPIPFTFVTGTDVSTGPEYQVSAYEGNPAWEPEHVESHYGQAITIGWHDVGVVILDQAVTGIDPEPFRTDSLDNMAGLYATWVGFGKTTTNKNNAYDTGVKYKATMMIADMWPQGFINVPNTANGNPLVNTCNGDSGGPSFLKLQGVEQIAGLVSSGDDTCTQMGYSTRIDTNVDWIESMILKYDPTWVPPNCGDGTCGPGETKKLCPKDCDAVPAVCGNGTCEAGETTATCPQDCPAPVGPVCGNGTCESGETTASCPQDCPATVGPVCGNGTCEDGETSDSCPADCPAAAGPVCGNGTCEDGEDCAGCPADCGECPTAESTDPELASTDDVGTATHGHKGGGCAAGASDAGTWLPIAGFLLAWARRRRS